MYQLLQFASLLMLIARLVGLSSVQPRLGLIPATLVATLPALAHVLLVVGAVCVTGALSLVLCLGTALGGASIITQALTETCVRARRMPRWVCFLAKGSGWLRALVRARMHMHACVLLVRPRFISVTLRPP